MPIRKIPLVTGEYYHVFNRGINHQPTFLYKRNYQRALASLQFCSYSLKPVSYSKFRVLNPDQQLIVIQQLKTTPKLVTIIAFCLMPNHFHLLLKQNREAGISKFLSDFQNGYTRYFNSKNNRTGPLFNTQFKAVHIETDEQLIHVSRYIHLNPYTSHIIKNIEELLSYPWSSFPEYLSDNPKISDPQEIMSLFKNKKEYQEFVFDQAGYQRELNKIKHKAIDLN